MKKSTRLLALVLSLVLLAGTLAGCGTGKDDNATSPEVTDNASNDNATGGGDPTGASGDGVKLSLAINEAINSLDPAMNVSMWSMQMITLTNFGLMSFGEDGGVTYGLADSYTVSDDGLTYTFHIRDDAYWNNGSKVTAYDFLFSWTRVTDPATGAPCAYALGASGVKNGFYVAYGGGDISELGIAAPDEETFVVTLDAPRSYFLYLTALASYLMPINEKYFNSVGDQFGKDKDHYLACGPYVFSDWEVGGSSYTLVKNDKFYDADNVTCEEIEWKVITDTSQQMMAWDNGTLDYAGLSGDYVALYESDPALVVDDMAAMFFLSYNLTDESLANKDLRLALSLAIDKSAIVNSILNNGSKVADYILPETFAIDSTGTYFRDAIGKPTYNSMDKTAAAAYWETALSDLGVTSLSLDLLYNEDTTLSSICAFLKSEWENTLPGLTINLVQTTYNDRLDRMGQQNYQIGLTRWYADYPDPSTYLDMWTTTSTMNYGQYSNSEYDALAEKMNGELALNEQERIKAMGEMEKLVLEDAAICPLYQLASCNLQNTDYNWVKNAAGVVQYQWTSSK